MSAQAGRHPRIPRRSFATGATLVAALATSGCISGSSQEDAGDDGEEFSGTVEWWTINLQKNFSDYVKKLISDYTSEHPDVEIHWVDVPGQDINTKLLAALASDSVPDAVNFGSDTIGQYTEAMTDLNDYFSADEMGSYQESLVSPLQGTDGKQIAIPWYNGGARLGLYRKSALKDVAFEADNPPRTWDEAIELAQGVQDATESYGANMMAYTMTVQSEGIPLVDAEGTSAAFNTPECMEVLEKFKEALDSGAIAPGVLGKDERSYEQSLENKQIAFYPSRVSSDLTNIEKNAPDVYEDLAVSPAVTGPNGVNYIVNQQVFGIPSKSKQKAAAAAWLKWVTEATNQLALCKLVPIFPSTPKSLEDPYFSQIDTSTPSGMGRKILVDTFPSLEDGAMKSHNDVLLRDLFDEQVRAYASGNKGAEDALDQAEQQWNAELSR